MLQQVIDVMDENQIEEINLWEEINVYDYKFCKQRFVFKICEMDSDGIWKWHTPRKLTTMTNI